MVHLVPKQTEILMEGMTMKNRHIFPIIFIIAIGCEKKFEFKPAFPSDCEKKIGSSHFLWGFECEECIGSIGNSLIEDVDGDGKQEVIVGFAGVKGRIYALNGEDGSILWTFKPKGATDCFLSSSADLNGDGKIEVVASCGDYNERKMKVYALKGKNGSILWSHEPSGIPSYTSIGDVDGDGIYEVILQTLCIDKDGVLCSPHYIYALNGEDGSILWKFESENPRSYFPPSLGDIDGDGKLEIGSGASELGGELLILNGGDGSLLWEFYPQESIRVPPTYVDMDDDGNLEVIIRGSKHIYALRNDGSIIWSVEIGWGGSPLSVGKEGSHLIFLSGDLRAINENGEVMWNANPPAADAWLSPVIGDIDGDGKLEALHGKHRELYLINLEDGSFSFFYEEPWDERCEDYYSDIFGCMDLSDFFLADVNGDCILDVVAQFGYKISVISTGSSVPPPPLLPWPAFMHDVKRTGLYTGDPYPPW